MAEERAKNCICLLVSIFQKSKKIPMDNPTVQELKLRDQSYKQHRDQHIKLWVQSYFEILILYIMLTRYFQKIFNLSSNTEKILEIIILANPSLECKIWQFQKKIGPILRQQGQPTGMSEPRGQEDCTPPPPRFLQTS